MADETFLQVSADVLLGFGVVILYLYFVEKRPPQVLILGLVLPQDSVFICDEGKFAWFYIAQGAVSPKIYDSRTLNFIL